MGMSVETPAPGRGARFLPIQKAGGDTGPSSSWIWVTLLNLGREFLPGARASCRHGKRRPLKLDRRCPPCQKKAAVSIPAVRPGSSA